ncbi:Fms-interacting protein-domain-containing protein [Lipomyces kononenkoae]|uniref:Fms-interacting protein-domain-containing protein n=1 Tax=Lipomyces kononenkoae TaxID=34357 RepID=A0ACC3T1C9_LIPKO
MSDTDQQNDTLSDALLLIRTMRDLSDRAFELLIQLSEASAAAAASMPSPAPEKEPEPALDVVEQHHDVNDNGELTAADAEVHTEVQDEITTDQMNVDGEPAVVISKDPAAATAESEFTGIAKALLAHSFQLRKINRLYQVSSKDTKDHIAQKRIEVERLQLELQNMYYRQRYLRKEIELCNDFPSSHTLIDFVPVEQFYEDNPEFKPGSDSPKQNGGGGLEEPAAGDGDTTMAETGNERLSQHKLMMARLEDERTRRLKMEEKRKELSKIRSNLVAENKKRKEDLESLDAQLQRFIESATPIQNVFQKY